MGRCVAGMCSSNMRRLLLEDLLPQVHSTLPSLLRPFMQINRHNALGVLPTVYSPKVSDRMVKSRVRLFCQCSFNF